jgi:predicted lipoprotein
MARTAGDLRGWLALTALGAAAVLQPLACNDGAEGEPPPAADVMLELLAGVGPEVVQPALSRASEAAEQLVAASVAWASAESAGGDTAAARASAQEAWRALMERWQEVEVLQIGPAASSLTAVGGQDLRDEVYSWPTTNPCRVDQETVYGGYAQPDFFEVSLVNSYGLDALETLLFSEPAVNACPGQVDINAEGTWDALGEDGVQQRRADYAVVLAGGVRDVVAGLSQAWDPAGGDFSGQVARAGEQGSPYASPEQALNAVFDALFYVELQTKDKKLGRPLGLLDCAGTDCADEVETPVAGGSNVWIAANLRSFRALFVGGEGTGMDELVRSLGEPELADAVLSALDQADAAAAALTVPVDVAATADPAPALALHAAVKGVTDLLKGDLATLLVLQVPSEAAGDND